MTNEPAGAGAKPEGALRVLFLGDVCAEPGRKAVEQELAGLRQRLGVDFVIANGENVAGGYGITPVLAGGLVYMPNDNGLITVIKPGAKFEYVSKNQMGERMYASPAISNGKIYLRGFQNLYCISKNGAF